MYAHRCASFVVRSFVYLYRFVLFIYFVNSLSIIFILVCVCVCVRGYIVYTVEKIFYFFFFNFLGVL